MSGKLILLACPKFGKLVTLGLCRVRYDASIKSRNLAERGGYAVPDLPCLRCEEIKPHLVPVPVPAQPSEVPLHRSEANPVTRAQVERKPRELKRNPENAKRKARIPERDVESLKRLADLVGQIIGGFIELGGKRS